MILISSFCSSFLTVVNFVIANPSDGEFFCLKCILAVYTNFPRSSYSKMYGGGGGGGG